MALLWPFVSRGRYEDLKAERDRIEAERLKLLDRLALLGLGGPLFEVPKAVEASHVEESSSAPRPSAESVPMRRRPSQIVADQTRKAFRRFHANHNHGSEERELILRQFDQIETDVVQAAANVAANTKGA